MADGNMLPLGIMPTRIWKMKRAQDLAKAINRYTANNSYEKCVAVWCLELAQLIIDIDQGKRPPTCNCPIDADGVKHHVFGCATVLGS